MKLDELKPIKPVDPIKPRIDEPSNIMVGKQEYIEIPIKKPFWKQTGFKRSVGGFFMLCGGIMSVIPATSLLGQGLFVVGSGIYGAGIYSAAQNSKLTAQNPDKGLWQTILELFQQLVEVLKKYKK